METAGRPTNSHLFLVRIWAQPDLRGSLSWRGKLQHIPSGEAHSFEDWTSLVVFLMLLSGGAGTGAGEPLPQGSAASAPSPGPQDALWPAAPIAEVLSDTKGKDDGS